MFFESHPELAEILPHPVKHTVEGKMVDSDTGEVLSHEVIEVDEDGEWSRHVLVGDGPG